MTGQMKRVSELQGGDAGEVGKVPRAHSLRSHSCKGWTSVTVREKASVPWRWVDGEMLARSRAWGRY